MLGTFVGLPGSGEDRYRSPFLYDSPLMCLDAAAGYTLVGGTTCSALADQTGNGCHATQGGVPAIQPLWLRDALRRPLLRFDGLQTYMNIAGALATALSGNTPMTSVLVVRAKIEAARTLLRIYGAGLVQYTVGVTTGTGKWAIRRQNDAAENDIISAPATTGATVFGVIVGRYSGSQLLGRVNETTMTPADHAGAATLTTAILGATTAASGWATMDFYGLSMHLEAKSDDWVAERVATLTARYA